MGCNKIAMMQSRHVLVGGESIGRISGVGANIPIRTETLALHVVCQDATCTHPTIGQCTAKWCRSSGWLSSGTTQAGATIRLQRAQLCYRRDGIGC